MHFHQTRGLDSEVPIFIVLRNKSYAGGKNNKNKKNLHMYICYK